MQEKYSTVEEEAFNDMMDVVNQVKTLCNMHHAMLSHVK